MSKGKQMQKIVIKKPWGVEIKDYKAGDPIPAGAKYKIFDAKDTDKIDAYADSLDESATYQKKRFLEPAYVYNESTKVINEETISKKDFLDIIKNYRKDINSHLDNIERMVKKGEIIATAKDKSQAQVLGTVFDAELLRYNLAVQNKTLNEGFIITDTINGKPTYFHYGKFTGYDWGFEKDKATKFSTKEKAEQMIERMRQEGALVKDMKVIEEGRIAKGYENLDADEKARHLLSHPSSKYMNDLKSENITERAIRKAVKEMLGKPDKRDPQFIIDVNEGCIKESVYYIKSPSGFYVMKTDNSYDLTDDKEKALKYTIGNDAAKELAYIHRYSPDSRLKKLMVVQEEGEAPAIANTTAEVANPELPLKLKESESSDFIEDPKNMGFRKTMSKALGDLSKGDEANDFAFMMIKKSSRWKDQEIKDFLDSYHGRKFAEHVLESGGKNNTKDAITYVTKYWKDRNWLK